MLQESGDNDRHAALVRDASTRSPGAVPLRIWHPLPFPFLCGVMPRLAAVALALSLASFLPTLPGIPVPAAKLPNPPYPPSPVIERVEFDWKTHQRHAPGSDNWPATWGSDGHLYSAWGDGGGFGGSNGRGRVLLG